MKIPEFIADVVSKLEEAGFEAYIVGGSVRDLLMYKIPQDWDITTNAKPKEILKIFPQGKYENDFGTVLLAIKNLELKIKNLSENDLKQVIEITTYRSEQEYSDKRHPDKVIFEDKLEKDLARRDFTINAMALRLRSGQASRSRSGQANEIVDLFGGKKDIEKKIIRAVGEPVDRFKEDALRMMRAIRFASVLGFELEPKTNRGISKMAGSLKFIAKERIGDELKKILKSDQPYEGIMMLHETKLLNYIMAELLLGVGVAQNHHHTYSVFKHCVLSLKYCPSKDWRVRLAALLHDIGKPKTKIMRKGVATFYNHEYVSERLAKKIMQRLKFSNVDIEKVATLVRYHMFYYNTDEVTAASVRRLIKKVGKENLKDLIDLRIGDRLGSAVKKAKPYKLRHLEYMFDRVQNDPVSVKMLKLNGDYMIEKLGFKPGPKMGAILDVLLSEVIEDPKLNDFEYLIKRAKDLGKDGLEELQERAKEKIEKKKEKDDKKMKKEHWVK